MKKADTVVTKGYVFTEKELKDALKLDGQITNVFVNHSEEELKAMKPEDIPKREWYVQTQETVQAE